MVEQLTFTEDQVVKLRNFANFIFNKANFNCTHKEFIEYDKLYSNFVKHLKMCEDHIMELKEVVKPQEDEVNSK